MSGQQGRTRQPPGQPALRIPFTCHVAYRTPISIDPPVHLPYTRPGWAFFHTRFCCFPSVCSHLMLCPTAHGCLMGPLFLLCCHACLAGSTFRIRCRLQCSTPVSAPVFPLILASSTGFIFHPTHLLSVCTPLRPLMLPPAFPPPACLPHFFFGACCSVVKRHPSGPSPAQM